MPKLCKDGVVGFCTGDIPSFFTEGRPSFSTDDMPSFGTVAVTVFCNEESCEFEICEFSINGICAPGKGDIPEFCSQVGVLFESIEFGKGRVRPRMGAWKHGCFLEGRTGEGFVCLFVCTPFVPPFMPPLPLLPPLVLPLFATPDVQTEQLSFPSMIVSGPSDASVSSE